MKLVSRRALLSLSAVTAAAATTGCWGSFAATNKLWKFNDGISDSKWLKWLLFLGLVIVPVYSLFILGDALIFNTIEFFTDDNPLGASRDLGDGHRLAFQRDPKRPDFVRVEHFHHGKRVAVFYVERRGDSFSLFDEQRRLISATREAAGEVTVVDGRGVELAHVGKGALALASRRLKETGSPRSALEEAIDERARQELIARSGGVVGAL